MPSAIPNMLPEIDEVWVVDLCGLDFGPGDFETRGAAAPAVNVAGVEVQRIAELFRTLPPGEEARCHMPPFGLRFVSAGKIVCEASICWECTNVYGRVEGRDISYGFDGSSAGARELLRILERVIGHPAVEA
jgi:hypothetical protein